MHRALICLLAAFQFVEVVIGFDGLRGERVVLPPADEGRGHGQAGGDQLLQLGRLDGQHRVAGGAEDLVGQGQRQRGGAGNGRGRDLVQPMQGGKRSGEKRIKGF